MRGRPSKDRAESRVVNRYHKLYIPLIELVESLQDLEPGGMLVDNISIGKAADSDKIHLEYIAHPVSLTLVDGDISFTLQITKKSK